MSSIFISLCLSQLSKKGPKVLIRAITNYGIDINLLITLEIKYECTKVKTGKNILGGLFCETPYIYIYIDR